MRLLAILGLITVYCALSNAQLLGWPTRFKGLFGETEGIPRARFNGHTKTGGPRRGGAGMGGATRMGSDFGVSTAGGGGVRGSNGVDAGNFGVMGGTDGGSDLLVLLVPVSVTLQAKPSNIQQQSTKTE